MVEGGVRVVVTSYIRAFDGTWAVCVQTHF